MIVVDASVLIAHLDGSDPHHGRATELLKSLAGEEWRSSVLTLAEVFVGPARAGRLTDAVEAVNALAVSAVPLTDVAPAELAMRRATSGLRLPDCCVLLAAEQNMAGIATFDDRLAEVAASRGVTVHS